MDNRAVIRGVPWTLFSFGGTKVITLVTTVVLARLLNPADFGLMALTLLAFGFLGLLRDLGLGATLVLRQDFKEKELGTIMTLLIVTAAFVTLLVSATAPLAATLLNEPRLDVLLPVLSTTSVFASLAWFYSALFQREMKFKQRFVAQVTQSVGLAVTAIPLAIAGAGVWSLVIGQIGSMVIYSVTYLVLAPHRVRPAFDLAVAREAFGTSRGFLAQGGLAWVTQNIDYLLVGRLLGTAQLGYYSMAYRLTELTHLGIADPVAQVTFPTFARRWLQGEDVSVSYISALRLVAAVVCPIGVILSGAARPATTAIFGANWLPMIGPLAVLGIWAAVKPLQATVVWLLNSTGHAGAVGKATALILLPEIPLLVLAAGSSTTWVAWVILGEAVATLALFTGFIQRLAGIRASIHARVLLPIAVAAAAAWLATRWTSGATSEAAPLVSLLASAIGGTAVYAILLASIDTSTVKLALRIARRFFEGGPVSPSAAERAALE